MNNEYKEELEQSLQEQECPYCKCKDIGIDNWNIFEGKEDWFYYCMECDAIF